MKTLKRLREICDAANKIEMGLDVVCKSYDNMRGVEYKEWEIQSQFKELLAKLKVGKKAIDNIPVLLDIIEKQREALEWYSDCVKNYTTLDPCEATLWNKRSLVDVDGGRTARGAIKQTDEILEKLNEQKR